MDLSRVLSLVHRQTIDHCCQGLATIGLSHMVMYLIFNDGQTMIVSNLYQLIPAYYQDGWYQDDYTYTPPFIQPFQPSYYLFEQPYSLSQRLMALLHTRYQLYPVYNIIRHHSECTLVFSAIRGAPTAQPQHFYEQTVQSFETIGCRLLDAFCTIIRADYPAYRRSFILTNPSLREAVIKQGYDDDIRLSPREHDCLWFASQGCSAKEIGQTLQLSPYTVEQHLKQIRLRFKRQKLPDILLECLHRGLIGKVATFQRQTPFLSLLSC